jgi:transcriptional regulator with XRE-family HTH domain
VIEHIAAIVRGARERQLGSLDALAERSGVPITVLANLEQGRTGITTTQLDDVADALMLDPGALLQGIEVPRHVPSVFLRHAPVQDFDDEDANVLDEALEQGRSLAALRALLQQPPLALQAGIFEASEAAADRADAPAQHGYRLARDVRQWLPSLAAPLGDIAALVEDRFGIAVVARNLKSTRVTAVAVRATPAAAIVLHARDPQRARNPLLTRVYLVHELCHALFDPSAGGLHIVIDAVADRKLHAAEQRARAFAAELLLPLAGLTELFGPPREVSEQSTARALVSRARSHFGTPHEIAANHLCNLRFIDRNLRDWLEAERTAFEGSPPDTSLPPSDGPSRLVSEEVARAHREGRLTDGEAREILGLGRLSPLPWDEVEL